MPQVIREGSPIKLYLLFALSIRPKGFTMSLLNMYIDWQPLLLEHQGLILNLCSLQLTDSVPVLMDILR